LPTNWLRVWAPLRIRCRQSAWPMCQYIQVTSASDLLELLVPKILSKTYDPTPIHDFLVKLAQYQADPDTRPYPCIVTTCFDQVLEQQLRKKDVPFHLVASVFRNGRGMLEYTPPNQELKSRPINPDTKESFAEHAAVIKLNGGVPAPGGREGGIPTARPREFAITEDNYIDCLSHQGIASLLPKPLLDKLTNRNSRLLFLGCSPRHWNLRLMLRQIWFESINSLDKNWTVIMEGDSGKIDRHFWLECGLKEKNLLRVDSLEAFIKKMTARLSDLSSRAVAASSASRPVSPAPATPVRDGIFISYSHKDDKWRNELTEMLGRSLTSQLKIWHDKQIQPGDEWRENIQKALGSARAAVLLVSNNFLNSDFISKNELPPLLEAAKSGGCRLLWIRVGECIVEDTPIEKYQALYNGKKAVANLKKGERDEVWRLIATNIKASAQLNAG
jgi:hypothetical protein